MTREKQIKLMRIIDSNYYDIDTVNGVIYYTKKGVKHIKKPVVLPAGYLQYKLYNGKRGANGINLIVYAHQVIFMAVNGLYDDSLVIDHIDSNPQNNRIDNLRLVTQQENSMYSIKNNNRKDAKTIRSKDIKKIRLFLEQGFSKSEIARKIHKNRLATLYIINKILKGDKLKYE